MPVLSGRINFDSFLTTCILCIPKIPMKYSKMVKNLQCLKTPHICYLRHAEHNAKDCASLRGLDHDTLFLDDLLLQRCF